MGLLADVSPEQYALLSELMVREVAVAQLEMNDYLRKREAVEAARRRAARAEAAAASAIQRAERAVEAAHVAETWAGRSAAPKALSAFRRCCAARLLYVLRPLRSLKSDRAPLRGAKFASRGVGRARGEGRRTCSRIP